MKRCPYCAESIQDEAIKCRYCQSDLTAAEGPSVPASAAPQPASGSESPPPGSASGAGAVRFSHSGFRHVLGYGDDFFGIWGRDQPGSPVERYPRTDQGWIEAWNRFHTLEPQAVEVAQPAMSGPAGTVVTAPATSSAAEPAAPAEPAAAPEPAGPPPTGPRIGEGALRFSHSGTRYILGYGQDFFGIWDRETPGGPVMRFPRTDDGWGQAWNRFTAWEPKAIEVPVTGTAPPDVRFSPAGSFRSGRGMAGAIVILIAVTMVLGLVAAGLWGGRLGTISSFRRGVAGIQELQDSREVALGIDGLVVLIVVVTGIIWLVWQHRAHSNLRALGAAQLKYSPGWAVGWWLIPVANIVMPYLTVRELYKASDPDAGSVDWASRGGAGIVGLWWAGRLVAQALFNVGNAFADQTSYSAMRVEAWFFVLGNLAFVGLGLLAILVVRAIDGRQTKKNERMTAWTRSFGQTA